MKKLTEQNYVEGARILGCEVEAIKAVAFVESGGRSGFNDDGSPKILFEGHIFHKLTNGRFTTSANANISYPRWIRTYYNENQYKRLEKAMLLDKENAIKSASWGKFQIMGFNHEIVGFKDIYSFYYAMGQDENEHLKAFINFVIHRRLDDELRRRDWRGFAYGYNGQGYAQNQYDIKMEMAYNKYKTSKL